MTPKRQHDADLCERIRQLEERVRELEARPAYPVYPIYPTYPWPYTNPYPYPVWISDNTTISLPDGTSTIYTVTG
jgi:hypothetical protein